MRNIAAFILAFAAVLYFTHSSNGDTIQLNTVASNNYNITPEGIVLSYIDGSPENRDGPYPSTLQTGTFGGTTYNYVTGVGTPTQRLYGMEQLTSQSFKEGDTISVTIKATPSTSLDGLPALVRFSLASDWNDNYYLSNNGSVNIYEGTAGPGFETFTTTLEPYNFTAWPVNNNLNFDQTIASVGVIGIDFLSNGATGTSSDYVNGQLPSYGIVGQVSIGQAVATPEPSTLALLAVAGIAALVYVKRRKTPCNT